MSMRLARQRFEALPLSRVMEIGFTLFAIYFFSNARVWWGGSPSSGEVDPIPDVGNPKEYIVAGGIYFVALVLTLRRPRAAWRAATADSFLVAILGLALASALWSDAPDVVFRRGAALLGSSVFGVYLHVRYNTEDQLRLLGWTFGLVVVLNILQVGPSTLAEGAFNGVFQNKNSLGRMMALATLVFVFLAWTRRPRAPAVLFAGLSVVLLWMSSSATGLIVLLTVLSIIPFLRKLAQDMRLRVAFGSVAILVLGSGLLLGTSTLEAVSSLFGRDATLTGRTDLWRYIIAMIQQRPWFGYGYETFWLWALPLRLPVDEGAGWVAPNAHNGYLEVTLALGLVGLLIFTASLVRGAIRGLRHLRRQTGPPGLWPLIILCFVLLYNITEVVALARANLSWVLYVTALLAVSPRGSRVTQAWGQVRGDPRVRPWVARHPRPTGVKVDPLRASTPVERPRSS